MLDMGSPTAEAIFVEVGAALSTWAEIEEAMSLQFAYVLGSFNDAARAAFGHVVSVDARANMLSDAAEYGLGQTAPSLLKTMKALLVDTRQAAARRNDIAHGVVRSVANTPGPDTYFLVPPSNHAKAIKSRPDRIEAFRRLDGTGYRPSRYLSTTVKYGYTAEQIQNIRAGFDRLARRHRALLERILQWALLLDPPPRSCAD